jgi:hypothetical protein
MTAGAAGRGSAAFAAAWLAAFLFLAGDGPTAAAFALFVVGVTLPVCLLVSAAAARGGADHQDARLLGAAVALVLSAPLYIVRKVIPLPAPVVDAVFVAAFWLGAWRAGAVAGLRGEVRALLRGPQRAWLCVVLPALFCVSWLGYAVHTDGAVRFYGLYFVDFGNLLSIQNTVRASPGLPLSQLSESGPLGYHWLYFASSAWASELGGLHARPASTLILTNLLTASLFYEALRRACTRALDAAQLPSRFAPHLAGFIPLILSTLYAYQAAVSHLNRPWFTMGARNYLLLQLPHSLACFGNNTLALVLALLTLDGLRRWNEAGRWGSAIAAAALTAVLPGYSITLLFSLSAAVALWAASGTLRRPVPVLAIFGVVGAVALGVFKAVGVLSYGSGGGLSVSFDHGHFIQNVLFAFAPVTLSAALVAWRLRDRPALRSELLPNACLMVACLAIPTFIVTRGSPTAAVDFSMKTASLFLAAAAPIVAVAAAWLIAGGRAGWLLRALGAAVACLALVNSGAYFLQYAYVRARGRVPATSHEVTLDHARALDFVEREPSRLILLDELSIEIPTCDPAVMLGAKRVLVGGSYEQVAFPPKDGALANRDVWLAWKSGGFSDATASRRLAEHADLLIMGAPLPATSADPWRLVARFGSVAVYRSTRRG